MGKWHDSQTPKQKAYMRAQQFSHLHTSAGSLGGHFIDAVGLVYLHLSQNKQMGAWHISMCSAFMSYSGLVGSITMPNKFSILCRAFTTAMQYASLPCTMDYYSIGFCNSPTQYLASTDLSTAIQNLGQTLHLHMRPTAKFCHCLLG